MKRLFYRTSFAALLLVAAFVQNGLAQSNGQRVLNPDDVPLDVERLENFVPAGWKIKAQAAGDLNGDRQQDAVLALAFGNGKETALIVGFKNSVGGYTLAVNSCGACVAKNILATINSSEAGNSISISGVDRNSLQHNRAIPIPQ